MRLRDNMAIAEGNGVAVVFRPSQEVEIVMKSGPVIDGFFRAVKEDSNRLVLVGAAIIGKIEMEMFPDGIELYDRLPYVEIDGGGILSVHTEDGFCQDDVTDDMFEDEEDEEEAGDEWEDA